MNYQTPTHRGVNYEEYRKFGDNLKRILAVKGISQAELSRRMNFDHPCNVYNWCNGHSMPTRKNMIALLDILDINIEELWKETEAGDPSDEVNVIR